MSAPKSAAWPCSPEMAGCTPRVVARIGLRAGATDVAATSTGDDAAFWARVATESERITGWVIAGLGIDGRARAD